MTVFILGGGPAGLAVAQGIAENATTDFVLLERAEQLGGLARTVSWDDVGLHDLGPHKLFSVDRELMARVQALLPAEDWLTRRKVSSIYMHGRFLPYPPSPLSLGRVFGPLALARMAVGYAAARLRGLRARPSPTTFEEDLTGRLGAALYGVLFRPIALKLWGDPTRLDVDLSQSRVQTPSVTEILAQLLHLRKSSDFEALTFRYPRGGLQRLWEAIRARTADHGRFLLGHSVEELEVHEGLVVAIRCRDPEGRPITLPVGRDDFLVSTLPLGLLARMVRSYVDARTFELAGRVVVLNDLLLVFLHVDQPSLLPESWIFVPDPGIVFHRLSEQESFDPGMTPKGSIVCCEIMSNDQRPMSERSDDELIALTRGGLTAMGYQGFQVRAARVIRLPRSYPVFRPGYASALVELLQRLDELKNFRTIGRQGAFSYIGTLDAMDIGFGFARWHARGDSWEAERDRTRHYPILD